jgi:hypothetical protein
MDPLSALGIAAAVVQFVDFAPRVLFSAHDIYHSAKGLTAENEDVGEIYQALADLSARLAVAGESSSAVSPPTAASTELDAMRKLSLKCKEDCDALLDVVRNLAVANGKHRLWRSLRAAFRSSMDKKKVVSLEASIGRARGIVSTQILSILKCVLPRAYAINRAWGLTRV